LKQSDTYVVASVPERVWDMVAAIRRDLAAKARTMDHRSLTS
jgi:hypothetical protein